MAITKASASGLAGSKFKDASAGTTKIADLVDPPTIGTAVRSGVSISVPFTVAATGGTATSFIATGSTGGVTGTAASSPILVSGLTDQTSYTFTVAGINASGTGPASASSNAVTAVVELVWQAAQTFNTTQNILIGPNTSQIAMVAFSGGYSGSSGGDANYLGGDVGWANTDQGGSGGAMGSAASGVFTMPDGGATYLLSVGAVGGGSSSIGNLLTSSANGNASSKVAGNVQGGNSTGGNIVVGTNLFTPVTYTYGGAGGAGGSAFGNPGQSGFAPYGGGGGTGANQGSPAAGGAGQAASGVSGGGGGGGTGLNAGGGGGSGGAGRIIIYEKKPDA